MFRVYPLPIIFIIIALALSACRPAQVAKGISPDEQIAEYIAFNEEDDTPIAYVNGEAIQRGIFIGLAATIADTGGVPLEQAYQDVLSLLVQNMLIEQESERRGYAPTDEEAIERTRQHIKGAEQVPAAEKFLEKQAERFGVSPKSEEFVQLYAPTMKRMMLSERLNQHILEEVGDDPAQFEAALQSLLADLLKNAAIEVVYENLPPEAAKVHIPTIEELPSIKNPKPIQEEAYP